MHLCGNQPHFCGITGEREGGRETRDDDLEEPLGLREETRVRQGTRETRENDLELPPKSAVPTKTGRQTIPPTQADQVPPPPPLLHVFLHPKRSLVREAPFPTYVDVLHKQWPLEEEGARMWHGRAAVASQST